MDRSKAIEILKERAKKVAAGMEMSRPIYEVTQPVLDRLVDGAPPTGPEICIIHGSLAYENMCLCIQVIELQISQMQLLDWLEAAFGKKNQGVAWDEEGFQKFLKSIT